MKRRGPQAALRIRVPEAQGPFMFVPGKRGGWFVSLTWNFGSSVEVSWSELRKLLASSKGDVVIARKLVGGELKFFEQYRDDIDHEVHAPLIYKDAMRWRSPRKR